jgi:hypothetical protein
VSALGCPSCGDASSLHAVELVEAASPARYRRLPSGAVEAVHEGRRTDLWWDSAAETGRVWCSCCATETTEDLLLPEGTTAAGPQPDHLATLRRIAGVAWEGAPGALGAVRHLAEEAVAAAEGEAPAG